MVQNASCTRFSLRGSKGLRTGARFTRCRPTSSARGRSTVGERYAKYRPVLEARPVSRDGYSDASSARRRSRSPKSLPLVPRGSSLSTARTPRRTCRTRRNGSRRSGFGARVERSGGFTSSRGSIGPASSQWTAILRTPTPVFGSIRSLTRPGATRSTACSRLPRRRGRDGL